MTTHNKHRFANVSCSQCGKDFGPGDHGYSHCNDHAAPSASSFSAVPSEWLQPGAVVPVKPETVGFLIGVIRQMHTAQAAPQQEAAVDEIVTRLYRRFKDWSKRGFGPDDVTWCEVKADVVALLGTQAHRQESERDKGLEEAAQYHDSAANGWRMQGQESRKHYEQLKAEGSQAMEHHLEKWCNADSMAACHDEFADAIRALKGQPSAPAEPVAYLFDDGEVLLAKDMERAHKRRNGGMKLYAAPVAAPVVPDADLLLAMQEFRGIIQDQSKPIGNRLQEIDARIYLVLNQKPQVVHFESIAQLMKFYDVRTLPELVEIQSQHIERLQAKLPQQETLLSTSRVREG